MDSCSCLGTGEVWVYEPGKELYSEPCHCPLGKSMCRQCHGSGKIWIVEEQRTYTLPCSRCKEN